MGRHITHTYRELTLYCPLYLKIKDDKKACMPVFTSPMRFTSYPAELNMRLSPCMSLLARTNLSVKQIAESLFPTLTHTLSANVIYILYAKCLSCTFYI